MEISIAEDHTLRISDLHGLPLSGLGWALDVKLAAAGWAEWKPYRHCAQLGEGMWEVCCRDASTGLEAVTRFSRLGDGIWRRADQLRNAGSERITILSCLPTFCFAGGRYAVYAQDSRWCHENQGNWQALTHGERTFRCTYGRTTQGGTPWMALRDDSCGGITAFHVEPRGNWMVRCSLKQMGGDSLPHMRVGLGLDDESLLLALNPGETVTLPTVVVQEVPGRTIESAAPPLHRMLKSSIPTFEETTPLVYNTWFDVFDKLDTTRLQAQLTAAKEVGCDTFVVDAGWYGVGDGWAFQGDWREKQDRAFHGKMQEFADAVRGNGLRFGLWMEPEAIQPDAPVAREHPSWFLPGPGPALWPDLRKREARDWVSNEVARLIESYEVAWLKIDFNQPIGPDPDQAALSRYYQVWFDMLDDWRERFPHTFFENCAGGGQRLDQKALRHSHGHFLSDTVHPVDTIRILQGALLRLPPGPLIHWAVLRSAGPTVPRYGIPVAQTPPSLFTPAGATWNRAEMVDLDFAVAAAFPGILGFSGDLASLSQEQRQRLTAWVRVWKEWSEWIRWSEAVLLTPVRPLTDQTGWVALQLRREDDQAILLFVYRLDDPRPNYAVAPHGLANDFTYRIESLPDGESSTKSGEVLNTSGLAITLEAPFRAAVFALRPVR